MVVLVKDFGTAKQRLRTALSPEERRDLALANARRALAAAIDTGRPVLAVCGSSETEAEAVRAGAETILEAQPSGQNPAARRGIDAVLDRGGDAVLVVSSDLPLVSPVALERVIEQGERAGARAVIAAAATGRGGTNALYMRPPGVIGLHFGDDSLASFERDAHERGVAFHVHQSEELALDLDEPSDLAVLREAGA